MRKELILSNEDKLHKRFRKRKLTDSDDFVPSPFGMTFPSFDFDDAFKDYHNIMYGCNEELLNHVENYCPVLFEKSKLLDFVCQRSIISNFQYRNQRLEFESGNEWGFNQIEMFKFDELRRTSEDMLPKPYDSTESCPTILEGFKAIEIVITDLIKLIKKWAAFRILNIDEQISLLKLALVEIMFVFNVCNWVTEEPSGFHAHNAERNSRVKAESSLMLLVTTGHAHELLNRVYAKAIDLIRGDHTLLNCVSVHCYCFFLLKL